jgi:branched-chain amino acid transport system permease protein
MGGTLHAQYLLFVNPDFFGLPFTIEMVIRSILGGVGTLFGPIIGSFILTPLSEISRGVLGGYRGVHMMIYGVIMILFMLFLPHGVGAWFEKLFHHLKSLLEGKIRFSG